jgi:hypothetical protein
MTQKTVFGLMAIAALAAIFAAIMALANPVFAGQNCPTGYSTATCESWKRLNDAPPTYHSGGPAADSCAAIAADKPQAVLLKDADGNKVTGWRTANLNWQVSKRFSAMLGKTVWVTHACTDGSDFAKAGPGGRICGEDAESEMNRSENKRLAKGTMWSKSDPFCIMSQKDCRRIGMSWK